MTTEIAWEYDTRVWTQSLLSDDGDWRLVRRIKETRADDTSQRERAAQALAGRAAASVRFVAPSYSSDGAVYALTAPEVLASRLWPQARTSTDELARIMQELGLALASLHEAVDPGSIAGIESPHLRRLAAHLGAGSSTYAGLVVLQQKPEIIDRLREWMADLPRAGALSHGGFTLGSVFVDADLTRVELPTGDELMATAEEFDLGWMLGELTEFEYLSTMRGTDGSAFPVAARALLEGWSAATGRQPDPVLLNRVVALRYFLHLCDFAETTQSTDTGSLNAPFLAWLVERAEVEPQPRTRKEHES